MRATDVENSLQALKIFGISKADLEAAERQGYRPSVRNSRSMLRLRVSLSRKLVSPGQLIQAGATTCFVISDISKVWVQGHIFDRDLPSVHVGDAAEETNPSIPTVFRGEVEYIGSMLDAATRTTPVRIVTRNPGGFAKERYVLWTPSSIRGPNANITVVPVFRDPARRPEPALRVRTGSTRKVRAADRNGRAANRTTRLKSLTGWPKGNRLFPMAACSCSSQIPMNSWAA